MVDGVEELVQLLADLEPLFLEDEIVVGIVELRGKPPEHRGHAEVVLAMAEERGGVKQRRTVVAAQEVSVTGPVR